MSFITMEAQEVRTLAEKCLARIQRHKDQEKAAIIAAERERLEKSLWRRLWGEPVPDDEEIWRRLNVRDAHTIFTPQDMVEVYAEKSKAIAEKLLKAAKHAATVQVSAADLDRIA